MKRIRVILGDKELEITERKDGSFAANGSSFRYDIVRSGTNTYSVLLNGRSVTVLAAGEGASRLMAINGIQKEVRIETERDRLLRDFEMASVGDRGSLEVRAPMPALITAILVSPGDAVRPGQGLVIMEAMKMENEIRAQAEGTIESVAVQKGMAVDKNELLMRFVHPPQQKGKKESS